MKNRARQNRFTKSILRRGGRLPVVGRLGLVVLRLRIGLGYVTPSVARLVSWVFTSREHTNFTYGLTDRNTRHLAAFVSQVTGIAPETASQYFGELQCDVDVCRHVREVTAATNNEHFADRDPLFGRRLGWYAIIRARKPAIVVE